VQQSTISRTLAHFNEIGKYTRRPGQGPHRVTSRRDDRFLQLMALRLRHCTARMLQTELHNVRNVRVCVQTVRNRLREANLHAQVPASGPMLTREHQVVRLEFARKHVHWQNNDWRRVLFSDESRFCLWSSDRRVPVYRRPGEQFSQCNVRPAVNFGGGSVMVRGTISLEGCTELVTFWNGSLSAVR
ncbi:HTH Tnp Tc3 2 domain containing protein, partial [Asbolus verrucosus]